MLVGLAGVALGVWTALSIDMPPTDAGYSEAYVRATQTGAMAAAVWAALFFSFGAWLAGASLRVAFGVPARETDGFATFLRMCAVIALVVWLSVRALIGDALRFTNPDASPNTSLLIALLAWACVAADVPFLLRNGIHRLRARLPALMARTAKLASLPGSGVVSVSGTVATGPDELPGECVFVDRLHEPSDTAQAVSFLIDDGGHRAWVDVDRDRLVVVADPNKDAVIRLRAGDEVTVVAEVSGGSDDPYRGGLPRLAAPDGQHLRILAGGAGYNRRLLIAAIVALVSAGALIGAALLLVVFRLALAWG